MSWIEQLNSEGITDGLLIPHGVSARRDFSPMLGKDLSQLELRCYSFIHQMSFCGPVGVKQIYKEIYKAKLTSRANIYNIWRLIDRVREKLGDEAIITRPGLGYLSRRALNQLNRDE